MWAPDLPATGLAGLIGSETVKRLAQDGARIAGIDNDMRAQFFGAEASPHVDRLYQTMLEAIELCEKISGRALEWSYEETNRIGDHIWWISDVRKFQSRYPNLIRCIIKYNLNSSQ